MLAPWLVAPPTDLAAYHDLYRWAAFSSLEKRLPAEEIGVSWFAFVHQWSI